MADIPRIGGWREETSAPITLKRSEVLDLVYSLILDVEGSLSEALDRERRDMTQRDVGELRQAMALVVKQAARARQLLDTIYTEEHPDSRAPDDQEPGA